MVSKKKIAAGAESKKNKKAANATAALKWEEGRENRRIEKAKEYKEKKAK